MCNFHSFKKYKNNNAPQNLEARKGKINHLVTPIKIRTIVLAHKNMRYFSETHYVFKIRDRLQSFSSESRPSYPVGVVF